MGFSVKKYKYYDYEIINDSPYDAYNRFNMGINLGVGVSFDSYYVTVTYQRGFTYFDKAKADHLNIFRLGLGYNF